MQRFNKDIVVKVDTAHLLVVLTNNREEHIRNYNKALEGWRVSAVADLETLIAKIKCGETKVRLAIDPPPASMEKDYDLAISMVQWNTEKTMDLDQQQFNAFVRDDWEWKNNWSVTNSKYMM